MTIILKNVPEDLQLFIQSRMAAEGHASPEEYLCSLLRREVKTASIGSVRSNSSRADALDRKWLLERELAFQQSLVKAGLLAEVKIPPYSMCEGNFRPVRLEGPPLSETIIQDRGE